MVDAGTLHAAHAAGKELHAWTANTERMMVSVLDAGVDAVVTNHPGKLAGAIQDRWERCLHDAMHQMHVHY